MQLRERVQRTLYDYPLTAAYLLVTLWATMVASILGGTW